MTLKALLVLLIIATLSKEGERHVFTESGVDGLNIGEATLEQIKVKFPGGKTTKFVTGGKKRKYSVLRSDGTSFTAKIRKPKQTAIYYELKDEGIEFYLKYDGALSSITIWGKNSYSSDKGFELGTSTFGEADSLYGASDFGYTNGKDIGDSVVWARFSEGLLFFSGDTTTAKRSDSLVVDYIVIIASDKD